MVQTDHEVFLLEVDGKRVARTKLSRGSSHRTLDEPLVAEIARQLHISRSFLYQLARGENTPADYLAELRRQGIID